MSHYDNPASRPGVQGLPHDNEKASVHIVERTGPIHLSDAQYERLFFQPGGGPQTGDFPKRFANPTPLAIISYILALTPTSCILMTWDGAAPTSLVGIIGASTLLEDSEWTIAGIFEWWFFTTFGGFWLTLGVLFDPSKNLATAFTDGENTPAFNHGIQFYFTFWAVLCFLYLMASVRTNMVFVYLFATLIPTFSFRHGCRISPSGVGNATLALRYLKAAGACGFANIVGGWYLALVLIFATVEMPFNLPVGDLSGFLKRKKVD